MGTSGKDLVPTILFTGERSHDQYRVRMFGKAARLTHSTLNALVELVIARAKLETGFVPLSRVTVSRLRRSLDYVKRSAGRTLIETGCGEEYRLSLTKEKLAKHTAVAPSFYELVALKAISQEQADQLTSICRLLNPRGNRKDTKR
jgi:hypothetical protein